MSEAKGLTREEMAKRVAMELKDGYYVNLGIGIPTLIADYVPEGITVIVHSENGILGMGPFAQDDEADDDLVNAGKQPVTLIKGGCYFHHADSFAMIRGGHVDMSVMGGLQVSARGNLANWKVPGRMGSVGGAMDLVHGAKRVVIVMDHVTKKGEPKIVNECTYPLTGLGVVNTLVTNLAFIEITNEGLILKETAPGVTVEEIQNQTQPKLKISGDIKEMDL